MSIANRILVLLTPIAGVGPRSTAARLLRTVATTYSRNSAARAATFKGSGRRKHLIGAQDLFFTLTSVRNALELIYYNNGQF